MDTTWELAAGLWTALSMLLFLLVVVWAYSRHNRERFAEAAQLAVSDQPPASHTESSASNAERQEQQP